MKSQKQAPVNKTKELLANTILLGIGKLSSPLIAFIMVPIYTMFVMPSDFGVVDLIQSYAGLIIPIILLRLDIGLFRFIIDARNNKKEIKKIFTNTLAITLPILLLSIIIVFIANYFAKSPLIGSIIFYFSASMLSNILDPLVRGLGKNKLFTLSAFIGSLVNLAVGILFVIHFKMGANGIILSTALSSLTTATIMFFGSKAYHLIDNKSLNRKTRKELLHFSAPLIFDGISFWVINASDRTILTIVTGVVANGIYAVSNKFSNLINVVVSIFWISWSESTAKYINTPNYTVFLNSVLRKYARLLIAGTSCILAGLPLVFFSIIGSEFYDAYMYVPILIIASFFSALSTYYAPIYTAHKMSKQIAITTMISAGINLTIDLLLIKSLGIWAVAISTLVAYLFVVVYRYFDIKKIVGVNFDIKTIFYASTLAIPFVAYYINNPLLNIVSVLFSVVMSVIANREVISTLLNSALLKIKKRSKS